MEWTAWAWAPKCEREQVMEWTAWAVRQDKMRKPDPHSSTCGNTRRATPRRLRFGCNEFEQASPRPFLKLITTPRQVERPQRIFYRVDVHDIFVLKRFVAMVLTCYTIARSPTFLKI